MPHERQVVREAVTAALIAAATAAGTRVFPNRVIPMRKLELPAIAVYTLEEDVEADSLQSAPRELTRVMPVVIEGWVSPADATLVDNAVDDLALEIEEAMHADPYLGGAVGESILIGTQLEIERDGKRLVGLAQLTYEITYRTFAPRPPADAALDDFETVEATHNLGNDVHPDNVAKDQFNVEENP